FNEEEEIDQPWWNAKIREAYKMRDRLNVFNEKTTCYRLVHGEGDLLPGLVVDIYGHTVVIQAHSVGMYLSRKEIAEAIVAEMGDTISAVYDKSSGTLPFNADVEPKDGYLYRREGSVVDNIVLENGLKFHVDWIKGQKTGFFIDQRENRELVRHYSKGKKVLNTFCYTGGFSIYALSGGAVKVTSVDSSAKAVELAENNVKLNFGADAPHSGVVVDALDYLKAIDGEYDLIILDPPAFAKHRDAINNALKGYRRINAQAISQIAHGGILFTFSCSQAVSKEQFRNSVFSAAAMAGRKVKILHQLTQPADHPINIYHPEGEYLKGLVVYVE
ncbi:MAG: class I SAM-dependent rRNA methyltransferase, partial [Rikenellaceae bacterium]